MNHCYSFRSWGRDHFGRQFKRQEIMMNKREGEGEKEGEKEREGEGGREGEGEGEAGRSRSISQYFFIQIWSNQKYDSTKNSNKMNSFVFDFHHVYRWRW